MSEKNPFKLIDDGIMYCVNKGVKAWNWTTGRTKGDLAILLSLTGLGIKFATNLSREDWWCFETLGFSALTLTNLLVHSRIDRVDANCEGNGVKELRNEVSKRTCKKAGYFLAGCGSIVAFPFPGDDDYKRAYYSLSGYSTLLFAASDFIINAENPPRRKNCVSRRLDYLDAKLNDYRMRRAGMPVPEF